MRNPKREMKNWRSGGREVLSRLTSLNRQLAATKSVNALDKPALIAALAIDFWREVSPLASRTLDSRFKPIRHEIRLFAGELGLHKAEFVVETLKKLISDEKKRRTQGRPTGSLLVEEGGIATDGFRN